MNIAFKRKFKNQGIRKIAILSNYFCYHISGHQVSDFLSHRIGDGLVNISSDFHKCKYMNASIKASIHFHK